MPELSSDQNLIDRFRADDPVIMLPVNKFALTDSRNRVVDVSTPVRATNSPSIGFLDVGPGSGRVSSYRNTLIAP